MSISRFSVRIEQLYIVQHATFTLSQTRMGLESSADVLKLSLAFKNESTLSQFVWRDLVGNLDRVELLVSERENYMAERANFLRFVQKLLAPTLEKLGYTPRPKERMMHTSVKFFLNILKLLPV